MKEQYEDYSNEVYFQVGQRVEVDLPYVPKEQRDVSTGVIVAIKTRFPSSKALRRIQCEVRFDGKGNYIKQDYQNPILKKLGFGGVEFSIDVSQEHLKLLKP